jgi:Family of unknown function (DUF5681)
MTRSKKRPGTYEIGYGKPPVAYQFPKGKSGNPSGRPRRTTVERAKALALKEAYRKLTMKEAGNAIALPAIQAILRNQVALAAKGNGPAQRAVIAAIQAIEAERASEAPQRGPEVPPMGNIEAARRIGFLLHLAKEEEAAQAKAEAASADAGASDAASRDAGARDAK